MKETEQSMVDLTQAKALLEKIEGGQREQDLKISLPGGIGLPHLPCDFTQCMTPMYGAITDPRWKYKR